MSMSNKLDDDEFAAKIVSEGGVVPALEYGLKSTDLADQSGDLAQAWRAVEAAWKDFGPLVDAVETLPCMEGW